MDSSFRLISASFVGALMVALLGLLTNLIPAEKMIYFVIGIAVFVLSSGMVAYILNASSENYAEKSLNEVEKKCQQTLRHIQNEYTSSILRGAIIHDSELDVLERSENTEEIWVVTPLDLDHDVPGKVFFKTLKDNLDLYGKKYKYVIQDSEKARHNARAIAEGIERTDLMEFVLLDEEEWNQLPIVGIPVTIHNPATIGKLKIYVSTQQSKSRGQHWAVFSGWTTAQIIERTRRIVNQADKRMTLAQYAET